MLRGRSSSSITRHSDVFLYQIYEAEIPMKMLIGLMEHFNDLNTNLNFRFRFAYSFSGMSYVHKSKAFKSSVYRYSTPNRCVEQLARKFP